MQVIYTGKTPRTIHNFQNSHQGLIFGTLWANQETSIRFLNSVIIPYVKKTQAEKELPSDYPALAVLDVCHGQTVYKIYQVLEENHILVVFVPSNCTDKLQPLDLSINKPAKDHMRKTFHTGMLRKRKSNLKLELVLMRSPWM